MPDLKTIEGKVLIEADRYEELIKTEARIESLVTFLTREESVQVDTILLLLGFHVPRRKEKEDEEICEMDVEL